MREIKHLPVSELTDEEIAKVAFKRLETKALLLVYESNGGLVFLGRYRTGGLHHLKSLKHAYEEKFGPFKKMDEETD
jgi:hypothetical protein